MEIFVGNLSFDLSKKELEETFCKFGEISNIKMMFDTQGRFRGIAYISFVEDANAKNAIAEMNGIELKGRPMKVDYSRPARPRFNGFGAGFRNRKKKPRRFSKEQRDNSTSSNV